MKVVISGGSPESPGAAPAPPAAAPPGAGSAPAPARRWLLSVALLVVGNFMAVLDVTIVNVAVPSIQKDYGGSLDDVLWIATAYTLMLGVVVPLSSWLGDRFGLTRVYVLSLVAFAVGSAFCGLAGDLTQLIVFRVFQAIPGGIMPVVALTLVYRMVPRHKLGVAMGLFGLGIVFAPAVGPVLGGYFVEYVNWRLVFYVNVPVGLLGALAAHLLLRRTPAMPGRRFDLPGFACVSTGLFAVLLAAEEGNDWGWTGYRVSMLLVFGLLALALFVVVELEVEQPLLDLRVFRVWPFTASFFMLGILQVNLLGVAFLLPVFLQQAQHKEAFDAGLLLLPQAVATGLVSPIVGRLYNKIGPRVLGVVGLALCAYGTYLLCSITLTMTREHVILWSCVRGVGLGMSIMPIMTAGLAALPSAQTNEGSALTNVARQVSGAIGLALMLSLASSQQAQLFVDRSSLTPATGTATTSPGTSPGLTAEMIGRYQQLTGHVMATSYGNLFLLMALLTVAGSVLALVTRTWPVPGPGRTGA